MDLEWKIYCKIGSEKHIPGFDEFVWSFWLLKKNDVVFVFLEHLLVVDTWWVVEMLKKLAGKDRERLEETTCFWVWCGAIELELESLREEFIFREPMEGDEWKDGKRMGF